MQGESFLTNIKRVFSAFSIVSLFCNPIIYAQYEQYMLVYQLWVTCWLLNHGSSFFFQKKNQKASMLWGSQLASVRQTRTSTLHVCLLHIMSSEESLSETAVSEWHEGNSSGSDEDLPNRENLCVRPLSWQSIEVNGLMAQLDRKVAWCQSQWSENNGNRAHSETSIKPRSTRWCSWVCSGTHHLQ